jgi:hypothetical protein
MSEAVVTLTINPYPNGVDLTERSTELLGTATIQASSATYQTGGLSVPWGTLNEMRCSIPYPRWANFITTLGSGYIYTWTIANLHKVSTAYVVGQVFNYTAANGQVYLQRCTTAGTSAGTVPSSFSIVTGGTTADGSTCVWTCMGLSGGVLQVWTGAAAQAALTELTGNAAVPAAVSSDIVGFIARFNRF